MIKPRTISNERASGFPIEVPFLEHLGARLVALTNDTATVELRLQPWLMNSWQVAHGGIVMTLLDVAMAMAGRPIEAEQEPVEHPGIAGMFDEFDGVKYPLKASRKH